VVSGYDLGGLGPKVVAFATEQEAWALAKTKTVVYFFAAGWCPTCQAAYRDIKANYRSLPDSIVLVFVDYDEARDLVRKYGVASQHTYVIVGSKGEKKKAWSGSTTVAEIVRNAAAM
jgi:thiol-disulfide isomerase/thioredoxin